MSTSNEDTGAALRRSAYMLLICVGLGLMLGRILAVDAVDRRAIEEHLAKKQGQQPGQKPPAMRRPFLSANDRSRWATVRALVEDDMRIPGAPYAIDRVIQQPGWDTIDMVKAPNGHLYSSKPPLLSTIMAGEYSLIYRFTGKSLGSNPYEVGRFMLATFNVIPLLVYFLLLAGLVERLGTTDWGRLFVMAAAVFGTFLSTFAVVVTNHLPGAVCAVMALYAAVRIWFDGERRLVYFALVGLFGALLVAVELPGAALAVPLGLVILCKAPRQTLLGCAPLVLVVAAGFLGTNWMAVHSFTPPYMHRSETDPTDNWYHYTFERNGKTVESYWNHPQGIDAGEPSLKVYAFHVLLGHHGVFSLTPVWLLSVAGTLVWLFQRRQRQLRHLAILVGMVSLVCLAFYIFWPQLDRNYGGMASGFRWVFWLAPVWLVAMLPAADGMAGRRWTRGLALLVLVASVLSVSYPLWNPWTPPWLMDYLKYMGWL
jgi:hypothetical protein